MRNFTVAKEIAGLVKEIEILDSKVESLTKFAGKLINSKTGHVEMALEEFDFEYAPTLQYMPAPPDPEDDPNAEPRMMGYSKLFNSPGEVNIYSVLIENDMAMSVIDTVIGKMKTQKQTKQNKLDMLLVSERIYEYKVTPGQLVVPVTINKKRAPG
ncbi:hypothetical protein LCGC14_0277850 [marine sediment metagenome]|uniref:Uncharacterized protein n=1 Tax=marine sediment metagenome TaxID=412755 RepID=A0A0F9WHQ7_9ZZZZ